MFAWRDFKPIRPSAKWLQMYLYNLAYTYSLAQGLEIYIYIFGLIELCG